MTATPTLLSQQGLPSATSSDELEEAVLWDYSFTFVSEGNIDIEVTWNEQQRVSCSIALSDADGLAEVRVVSSSEGKPVVSYPSATPIAANGATRFRMPNGKLLTFEEATALPLTVIYRCLDILDVQSARASVNGVVFLNPLLPFIENGERIDAGGTRATLTAHVTSILKTLLGNSPFASQPLSLECRYGYAIGGVPVEAPVVLVTRQDVAIGFDEMLIEQIAGSIHQWLEAVQPPAAGARLVFGVSCWSAIPRIDAPLLRLSNIVVPMADVIL